MRWPAYSSLIIALALPSTAWAVGPFGVNMGDKPEQFGCTPSATNPMVYTCENVPQKHPDMEMYVIRSTPETGICWIKGVSGDLETNSFGTSLQLQTDKIADQVSKKYGKPEKNDFLRYGSIWKDGNDWVMGLKQKERFYSYSWDNPKVDNNVSSIFVSAQALNSSTGFVGAEFTFSNHEACEQAEKNTGAGAF